MSLGFPKIHKQLSAWLMRRTAASGVRRVAPVGAALATELGEVRGENQDRIVVARGRDKLGHPFAVIALADGIGGMREGEECAALALGSLIGSIAEEANFSLEPREWLFHGVHHANENVHAKFRGEGGSTLAAVLVAGDGSTYWASVGDSRIYQANGPKITQLSTDDTIAGQLGRGGEAGYEQSKLIQFMGIGEPLEVSVSALDISAGGEVFIATDGVHFLDSTPWFGQLIKHAPDPGVCVRRLVELSKWCGGPDNASVGMIVLGSSIDDGMPRVEGVLEIWDPFGELQVIEEARNRPVSTQPVELPKIEPVISRPSAPMIAAKPTNQEESVAPAVPKKARAPRKSKATSIKGQQAKKAKEKKEAPQLLIEFPNKTG